MSHKVVRSWMQTRVKSKNGGHFFKSVMLLPFFSTVFMWRSSRNKESRLPDDALRATAIRKCFCNWVLLPGDQFHCPASEPIMRGPWNRWKNNTDTKHGCCLYFSLILKFNFTRFGPRATSEPLSSLSLVATRDVASTTTLACAMLECKGTMFKKEKETRKYPSDSKSCEESVT